MLRFLPVALLVGLTTSCATIVSKTQYPVRIDSEPQGASFVVRNADGQDVHSGVTPATVTLGSKGGYFQGADYAVTLNLEGYPEATVALEAGFDVWYVGNLIFGGLIGILIVDPLTGAMWKLDSELVVPLGAAPGADQPAP